MSLDTGPGDDPAEPSTRDRLLDAAIHIAGHDGRDRVTYRAVAGRAGVAHGLVRHYFGSRERLLEEALRRASALDTTETGIEAPDLDSFARDLVSVLNRDPARALVQFDSAVAAVRGRTPLTEVRRDYGQYVAAVEATLAAAGLPDRDGALARVVFAALDGLSLQHLVFGSDERTEAALEALRELLALVADRRSGSAPREG